MAAKLMHAVQYKSFGGGPSALKVLCLSAPFVYVFKLSYFSFGNFIPFLSKDDLCPDITYLDFASVSDLCF